MEQTRIFFVNTKQTFAGSSLWSKDLIHQKLGNGKWEVFWSNYSDEHPELDVNRFEGELTSNELFSLIDRYNKHVGVCVCVKKQPTQMLSFKPTTGFLQQSSIGSKLFNATFANVRKKTYLCTMYS